MILSLFSFRPLRDDDGRRPALTSVLVMVVVVVVTALVTAKRVVLDIFVTQSVAVVHIGPARLLLRWRLRLAGRVHLVDGPEPVVRLVVVRRGFCDRHGGGGKRTGR